MSATGTLLSLDVFPDPAEASVGNIFVLDKVTSPMQRAAVEVHEIEGTRIRIRRCPLSANPAAARKRKSRQNAEVRARERQRQKTANALRRADGSHEDRLREQRFSRKLKQKEAKRLKSNLMEVLAATGSLPPTDSRSKCTGIYQIEVQKLVTETIFMKHSYVPRAEPSGAEPKGVRNLITVQEREDGSLQLEEVAEQQERRRSSRLRK